MEFEKVGQVIGVLTAKGLPAEEGYPGKWMGAVPESEARVWLYGGNTETDSVTLAVAVLTNSALGAEGCRKATAVAVEALQSVGCRCRVGQCRFEGETGLFLTEIFAEVLPDIPVKVGAVELNYVTKFQANWIDEDSIWMLQLEERYPFGAQEQTLPGEPFSVICRQDVFENCYWRDSIRQWDDMGMRRVWTAKSNKHKIDSTL